MRQSQPFSVRFADAVAGRLARVLPLWATRLAYRLGHSIMRVLWIFTRPVSHGSKVAVVRDRREVLLVLHTYGPRNWDLPGGTAAEGEEPVSTASRELAEETGLSGQLESIGEWKIDERGRRGSVWAFRLDVTGEPELSLDPAELAEVRWWPLDALPPRLGGCCPQILAKLSDL